MDEDFNKQLSGLNFNFDQIKFPPRQPVEPQYLPNYEPLRPTSYVFDPSTHNLPYSNPEHQDDGGDGGGDDSVDEGDDGNSGGGNGESGRGIGLGGGEEGIGNEEVEGVAGGSRDNGRGSGGGSQENGRNDGVNDEADSAEDDGDDAPFTQNEPFEVDYDNNFESRNGWRPVQNKPSSDISDNQFRRPLQKKIRGYGTNHISLLSDDSHQRPYGQYSTYKHQSQRFSEEPYSHSSFENKRPTRIYDDDSRSLRLHDNKKRPLKVNGKNGRSPYNTNSKGSEKIVDEEIEEDDPRPLQSRRSPTTKKRQVCQKVKKSMSSNDVEDHDIIGRKMTCRICKDLSSGGTFEKCSYKSDPTSDEYLDDSEIIPKQKSNKARTNRYKRRIVYRKQKKPQSGEEIEDYEYENSNTQASEENPEYVQKQEIEYDNDDPTGNLETTENVSEEFVIPPLPLESSLCHKVLRKGNVCNVCQDTLSNRQYEQCEYDNDPSKNAYEYSTRGMYGNLRYRRQLDSDRTYDDYFKKLFPELGSNKRNSLATKFSSKDGDFGFLDNGQIGFKKRKSSLLRDNDDLSINFDSVEESPVNRMLGEFRNKDRSNCKRSIKNKMTCYKCKDDKQVETEECMYITDNNQPKEQKQTYHEKNNFNRDLNKSNPNGTHQQSASTSLSHAYAPLFSSKYEPTAQYSDQFPQRGNYRLERKPVNEDPEGSVEVANDQAEAQSGENDDEIDDPSTKEVSRHDMPDVDPFGPEGVYSEETIPMYDTSLQTWLPQYMVLKSSEEAMVDEELGFD